MPADMLWSGPVMTLGNGWIAWCRLPLGVPSPLFIDSLQVAYQLIMRSQSPVKTAGRSAEREAGYILLGALSIALPPEVLQVASFPGVAAKMGLAICRIAKLYLHLTLLGHHFCKISPDFRLDESI